MRPDSTACGSQGLKVTVPRNYEEFMQHLASLFPAEKRGIRQFYNEAWQVSCPSPAPHLPLTLHSRPLLSSFLAVPF